MLDLLTLMLTIAFVHFLLSGYRLVFPPIFDAGRHVADVLGNGIGGVDGTSMAEAIFRALLRLDLNPACDSWDCIGKDIMTLPATVFAYVMAVVLGIIATLVELWTLWGFQIAFAVGWVTVPFLLFERLSFLFDGWLKFFFGMIIYVLVAKVNLALVLIGLKVMLNLAGEGAFPVSVTGFFNLVGMFVFVAVSICTLFCTGKFASAIVNNAAGGGVGDAVKKIASTAATVARVAAL
jgi:type IV secretory pathway TrbL component